MKLLCIKSSITDKDSSAPDILKGNEYTPTDIITSEELVKAFYANGFILNFVNPILSTGYWYELAECGSGSWYHEHHFAETFPDEQLAVPEAAHFKQQSCN